MAFTLLSKQYRYVERMRPCIAMLGSVAIRRSSYLSTRLGEVSSYGRVRSVHGHTSWGSTNVEGYQTTYLRGRTLYVHRLVAHAFLGPPPPVANCRVIHKDGSKSNNAVSNLAYATHSESVQHSNRILGDERKCARGSPRPVLSRHIGSSSWTLYPSMKEAAQRLGVDRGAVSACCRGGAPTVSRHEFQFASSSEPKASQGELWCDAVDPESGSSLPGWKVSSHGRVRSSLGVVSIGSKTTQGYRRVGTRSGSFERKFYVHRLVARAFLGACPLPSPWDVNHKDLDRSNNRVQNLEYLSRADNIRHARRENNTRKYSPGRSKPVWARRCGSDSWTWHSSLTHAARVIGMSSTAVSACCVGKLSRAKGYEFKFAEPLSPGWLEGEEWRDIIVV